MLEWLFGLPREGEDDRSSEDSAAELTGFFKEREGKIKRTVAALNQASSEFKKKGKDLFKSKPDLPAFKPVTPLSRAQSYYQRYKKDFTLILSNPESLRRSVGGDRNRLALEERFEALPHFLRSPLTLTEVDTQPSGQRKNPEGIRISGGPAPQGSNGDTVEPSNGKPVAGVPDGFINGLTETGSKEDHLGLRHSSLDKVAFHDFASYDYIFKPHFTIPASHLKPSDTTPLSTYLESIPGEDLAVEEITELYTHAVAYIRAYLGEYPGEWSEEIQDAWAQTFIYTLMSGFPEMIGPYTRLNPRQRQNFLQEELGPAIRTWIESSILTRDMYMMGSINFSNLAQAAQTLAGIHSPGSTYLFFPPETVNFGLRLVYRQEWRSLGNQFGEIIRTIPLGPRQTEKISTKILRRNKATRQLETIMDTERTSETSETIKDSSEVVEEAASATKWHAEAEASASVDLGIVSFGGGGGGGTEDTSSDTSRETKTRLSETMQKTAHKMRRQTKITVSTETESTFEETRSTEITNPNDEIAVTYAYQRLQRQYEIHTYLAEVASVVFVAEPVPAQSDILEWARRHDWIIAKVLLDESFRETLNALAHQPDDPEELPDTEISKLDGILTSAKTNMEAIYKLQGTTSNLFDSAQANYLQVLREKREKERRQSAAYLERERFRRHIIDNILHYCRAVWNREDPEQRLLRYRSIYVPIQVDFLEDSGTIGSLSSGMSAVSGTFVVNPNPESFIPLSDLINPAGPIGFAGNYAIFHLKNSSSVTRLNTALQYLKRDYAEPELLVKSYENNQVPAQVTGWITDERFVDYGTYELRFKESDSGGLLWQLNKISSFGGIVLRTEPFLVPLPATGSNVHIQFPEQGFDLLISTDPFPKAGDLFRITVLTQLIDPELRTLRQMHTLPPVSDSEGEARLFTDDLISDMAHLTQGLEDKLRRMGDGDNPNVDSWRGLNRQQKDYLRSLYHDFLLRRKHSRKFLMDTNSLVLNLITGEGSTLEPFKRAHRYLDVAKAATEVERQQGLLARGQYGDPDVERVVVVKGKDGDIGSVVAGMEAGSATTPITGDDN